MPHISLFHPFYFLVIFLFCCHGDHSRSRTHIGSSIILQCINTIFCSGEKLYSSTCVLSHMQLCVSNTVIYYSLVKSRNDIFCFFFFAFTCLLSCSIIAFHDYCCLMVRMGVFQYYAVINYVEFRTNIVVALCTE